MKLKKGQAAIEYFMVYGWALVIVVVIMTILYSTIFKPEFYIMEKCDVSPGLDCVQERMEMVRVEGMGTEIKFDLTNLMGYDINITNITFYSEKLSKNEYTVICTQKCTSKTGQNFAVGGDISIYGGNLFRNGETKTISIIIYDIYPDVDRIYRVKFNINYLIPATGTYHKTAGILNVRARQR